MPHWQILEMKATDLNEFQLQVEFTKSVVLDMSFTQSVVYTYWLKLKLTFDKFLIPVFIYVDNVTNESYRPLGNLIMCKFNKNQ